MPKPKLALLLPLLLGLGSCATRDRIWNSGDLARWVRDEAADQGYVRDSIELEEWYRKENGQLVWHGRGVKEPGGRESGFAIRVDEVWTPSGP